MAAPHPNRPRRARRCVAALVVAAAWPLGPSLAQEAPAPGPAPAQLDEQVLRQIDALDSPDVQERIDATHGLMSRHDLPLPVLERALRQMPLTPEQRQRLRTIARHRFATSERGALGVSWQPSPDNTGPVTLSRVLPGFPCAEVLRIGDRIEAIEGMRLFDGDRMRAIIVSRDPGDEITIDLVREGKPMQVKCRLGGYSDLNSPAMLPEVLPGAWLVRSAKYAPGLGTPVIDPGLPGDEWERAEADANAAPSVRSRPVVRRPGADWPRLPEAADETASIVAGGEARGAIAPDGLFGGRYQIGAEQGIVVIQRRNGIEVRVGQDPAAQRNQMMIEAIRERAMLKSQKAEIERALAEVGELTPEQRQSINNHLRALDRELLVLEARIRALQDAPLPPREIPDPRP